MSWKVFCSDLGEKIIVQQYFVDHRRYLHSNMTVLARSLFAILS